MLISYVDIYLVVTIIIIVNSHFELMHYTSDMTVKNRDNCPILRATDVMGDQWSLLILREFFLEGPRRFQDLQSQLGLSPNTLSGRLKKLEAGGVVERQSYSTNPPREKYVLTKAGKALGPVMNALREWGSAHTPDLK